MQIIYHDGDIKMTSDTDTMLTTIEYKGEIIEEMTTQITEGDAQEIARSHQMIAFLGVMAKNIHLSKQMAAEQLKDATIN